MLYYLRVLGNSLAVGQRTLDPPGKVRILLPQPEKVSNIHERKMKPELIVDYQCHLGEGPIWHPFEKRIYWLDISRGLIFWLDPATKEHRICYEGETVGGMTIQKDGTLLLFMAKGTIAIWRDGQLEQVISEIPEVRESRFNDVIADPVGRVFCGTLSTEKRLGRLYRLNTDGSITTILEDVKVSNGMGFSPNCKHMYHTDSRMRKIYLFDYDQNNGNLTNRHVFVETPANEGAPDGMTVDAEGYVWSARWGAGILVRYTPQGVEQTRIQFPARKVSSVTFGGEDYTDLYVTTAGGHNKSEEGQGAGALFRLRPGVRGVPEFFSRVGLQILPQTIESNDSSEAPFV